MEWLARRGGWHAQDFLDGEHRRRWGEVIAVGESFHEALVAEARPGFLDRRVDPWAIGDRVAWDELSTRDFRHVAHLDRLARRRQPIAASPQLIHGDLAGNVLLHDVLPPAVIDFSPYWRPASFGLAVIVADALVWEGADETILDSVSHVARFEQYLVRALIFRAVTARVFADREPGRSDDAESFAPIVDLVCRLSGE